MKPEASDATLTEHNAVVGQFQSANGFGGSDHVVISRACGQE